MDPLSIEKLITSVLNNDLLRSLNCRIRKMLEHRCQADAERFKQLEAQLKEARNTADDSDRKYDSVSALGSCIQFARFT